LRPYVVRWLADYLGPRLAELLAPSWFTCVGCAGFVALAVIAVLARRRGIDRASVAAIVLWGYIAAVAAGIVVPMAIDAIAHAAATGRFRLHWAGMTSFWGYLAGGGTVAVMCRRNGVSLARFADLAVIPLGLALVLARLGCFLAGCDYGKVSALPWAVQFPAGSPAWHDQVRAGLIPIDSATSLAVHPTELYEAMLGLAIIALAFVMSRWPRRAGELFLAAAATYALGRIGVELVRGDAERGVYHGISSGQIFCTCVLVAITASKLRARAPRAPATTRPSTPRTLGSCAPAER
jgi:phosphatidylglycerol:prolipoprotein diacylglycerol transferase